VIVREESLVSESLTTDDQLLVTPEEAARRLSVGRTTIYELMSSGELQSVNIGRCRRVPVSSLSSFVSKLIGDVAVER
jgi:excisionase family DNA binding protein